MGTRDQSCFDSIEHGYLSEKIERALTRQLRDLPLTETDYDYHLQKFHSNNLL